MSDLTPEQSSAAKAIEQFKNGLNAEWMFSLAGFAGTGKTFLLQRLINEWGTDNLVCCAPTGKAASVLQNKLKGVFVKTLHQALYIPRGRSLRELDQLYVDLAGSKSDEERTAIEANIFKEKSRLNQEDVNFDLKDNATINEDSLVIIDEASMVDPRIVRDLESTGCLAIFVGDSGQLPPVKGVNWFLERDHDARLISIQRQAEDSPIIRLSKQIREGNVNKDEFINPNGACRILPKDKVSHEEWLEADQILTGRNASRQKINRFMRKKLGRTGVDPVAGEKLICLKNEWRANPPKINGVIFEAASDSQLGIDDMFMDIVYEGKKCIMVPYFSHHTRHNYDQSLVPEPPELRHGLMELDYGYAITVHKSQGSEWDNVLVADDRMQEKNTAFRQRWLYTAVTRASKKLTIVQ